MYQHNNDVTLAKKSVETLARGVKYVCLWSDTQYTSGHIEGTIHSGKYPANKRVHETVANDTNFFDALHQPFN